MVFLRYSLYIAIHECASELFEKELPEASRRLGKRDPDDVDLLALARDFGSTCLVQRR